jgi:hypothetical protein
MNNLDRLHARKTRSVYFIDKLRSQFNNIAILLPIFPHVVTAHTVAFDDN